MPVNLEKLERMHELVGSTTVLDIATRSDRFLELRAIAIAICKAPATRAKKVFRFDLIRDYLTSRGNVWTSSREMQDGLSLPRGTIATVLWNSHRRHFESMVKPGNKKTRIWRMAQPIMSSGDDKGGSAIGAPAKLSE